MIQKGITLLGIVSISLISRWAVPSEEGAFNDLTRIKSAYISEYDDIITDLTLLLTQVEEEERFDSASVALDFIQVRNKFKTISALFEYYNYDESKRFVNAPPLPKLEKNSTSVSILEPYGWQVMDESFCLLAQEARPKLLKNIKKVLQVLKEIRSLQLTTDFEYRHMYEALKNEYLRIYTLTLTGFENPCLAETSIELAYHSWIGCQALTERLSNISAFPATMDWTSLMQTLHKGEKYLAGHPNFETFDRAYFYKHFLRPVIQLIVNLHLQSGVETIDEVNQLPTAINYKTAELFSDSFFNSSYFTVLNENLDRPTLTKLGKSLFHEPMLSKARDMSCATCHQSDKAFTDGEIVKRIQHKIQPRNTPTLLNSLYAEKYFFDLRAHRILDLYDHILFNDQEFDNDYFQLVEDLKQTDKYVRLFEAAFPGKKDRISYQNVKIALTAYLQTLTSWNSDFDQFMRGQKDVSPEVINGFNLFMGKAACGTCHFPPNFSGLVPPGYLESESEILGVTNSGKNPTALDEDRGRRNNGYLREDTEIFDRSFKTPTIRNVALTAPYMHNGQFNTLEEVLEFYNAGGGSGLGFHVPHQTLPPDSLQLTADEMSHIILFMESLTDTISYQQRKGY